MTRIGEYWIYIKCYPDGGGVIWACKEDGCDGPHNHWTEYGRHPGNYELFRVHPTRFWHRSMADAISRLVGWAVQTEQHRQEARIAEQLAQELTDDVAAAWGEITRGAA